MSDDNKRSADDDDDEFIGPMPVLPPTKKKKVLEHERIYLDNLPQSEAYEKIYMHRDVITHLTVTK